MIMFGKDTANMLAMLRSRRPRRLFIVLVAVTCPIAVYCWLISDVVLSHPVPLYDAAQQGNWKQVQTLLAAGANPNETTELQSNRTALFWAVYYGRTDMARLLIQKGIKVDTVDTHGQTAMDYAGGRDRGHPSEVISLLRQSGAKKSSEL